VATKRPFGTSFAGFWTKKVGAFDSQLWAKKTVVFVDHIGLTQGISNQSLVARQSRLKPVLKDISAAIWSLPLKVDFDLQITVMASTLYRLMADRIGREYDKAQAKTIFRNLLDVSATVQIGETGVVVTLDKRAHNPYLVASGLADEPTPMPWFGNKPLVIRFD
jgi:hypothetical protein